MELKIFFFQVKITFQYGNAGKFTTFKKLPLFTFNCVILTRDMNDSIKRSKVWNNFLIFSEIALSEKPKFWFCKKCYYNEDFWHFTEARTEKSARRMNQVTLTMPSTEFVEIEAYIQSETQQSDASALRRGKRSKTNIDWLIR